MITHGWINDPEAVEATLAALPMPLFGAAAPHLSGSGTNKTSLPYTAFRAVNGGKYVDYPAQTIGCCVGRGFAHGVDLLDAVQITLGHRPEAFTPTSHEFIYGACREIGNYLNPPGDATDGASGSWAARAVSTVGTVAQSLVGPYSDRLAGEWGWHGVPAALKARAADHKLGTASLVTTYEELEDALANGYPVTVASRQGFTLTRDADGFCAPQGVWAHNMLIVGVRAGARPGACIFQSWGMNMPSGPLALDQPPNSFWADRAVVTHMLAMRDSWSLSGFTGYPDQTKKILDRNALVLV